MAFHCFGIPIENTTRVKVVSLCVAIFVICGVLIGILTPVLISKNKDNHGGNNETKTTTMASVSTFSRPQTSNITSSLYWTVDSYLTVARAFHGAVVFPNGSVMACGGLINSTSVTSSCDVSTLSMDWTAGPRMNLFRYYYTLTPFANKTKILAAGSGYQGYGQTAEVYDMISGRWAYTLTDMTAPRYLHSAILLRSEQILIMGGFDSSGNTLSSAELFIPSSNSFIRTNSMRVPRVIFTSTVLSDGLTVLVAGGENINYTSTASAELYTSGSWTSTNNDMTVPRSKHAAVLLQDGNVLVAGGDDGYSNSYASAEIYNVTTRTFIAVGSMKYRRAGLTLTLLPSGKVLATGGVEWSIARHPATCELYDPVTQTWSETRSLRTGRRYSITVLLNNSVLSTGGVGDQDSVLASCEKYYL